MSKIARILIVLIPVGLFAYLFVIDLAPSGERQVTYTAGQPSPFIERPLPDARVGELVNDTYYRLTGDPVYIALHTPQTSFDDMEVEVEFQPNDLVQIEIGPQVDIFSGAADLQPLYQKHIEDLTWSVIEQDGVRLFQRDQDYESIRAFLEDPPPYEEIATYHYEMNVPYLVEGYQPLNGTRRIYSSLRGYHKVVTYVKEEDILLNLAVMDMNRTTGADTFTIRIWNAANELAWEESFEDDGNESENQLSTEQDINLQVDSVGWPEGVYHIELIGTSDMFIREIETSLRYFTFVNQLYIADDVGYLPEGRASSFSTNARNFAIETFHAEADKEVVLGSSVVEIPNTHEKVYANLEDDGLIRGAVDVGGVKIVGDGKFAFTQDAFFDPDPHAIGPLSDLDGLRIQYVLTKYQPVEQRGEWMMNTVAFSIAGLEDEQGDIRLILSLPFVELEDRGVDLHAMTLSFLKDSITLRDLPRVLLEYLPGV